MLRNYKRVRAWQEYLNLAEKVTVQEHRCTCFLQYKIDSRKLETYLLCIKGCLDEHFYSMLQVQWKQFFARRVTLVESIAVESAERTKHSITIDQRNRANHNISRPFFRRVACIT